jgi:hypothetical protein
LRTDFATLPGLLEQDLGYRCTFSPIVAAIQRRATVPVAKIFVQEFRFQEIA